MACWSLAAVSASFNDQAHENIARVYGGSVTGSGDFTFAAANYQVTETGVVAAIAVRRTGGTSGTNADGSGHVFCALCHQ